MRDPFRHSLMASSSLVYTEKFLKPNQLRNIHFWQGIHVYKLLLSTFFYHGKQQKL